MNGGPPSSERQKEDAISSQRHLSTIDFSSQRWTTNGVPPPRMAGRRSSDKSWYESYQKCGREVVQPSFGKRGEQTLQYPHLILLDRVYEGSHEHPRKVKKDELTCLRVTFAAKRERKIAYPHLETMTRSNLRSRSTWPDHSSNPGCQIVETQSEPVF